MLETRQIISAARADARALDQLLIAGRESAIQRNLSEIQGVNRSPKYVARKAGRSSDVYLKSASEFAVEWYGSIALEDPQKSLLVSEFWRPLFSYATPKTVFVNDDFWQLDSDIASLLSQTRKAVVTADKMQARLHLCAVRGKIDAALACISQMPSF